MKNREVLSEEMLSKVSGGAGSDGLNGRPWRALVPDPTGHGKTQPGGNEDIFHRDDLVLR